MKNQGDVVRDLRALKGKQVWGRGQYGKFSLRSIQQVGCIDLKLWSKPE